MAGNKDPYPPPLPLEGGAHFGLGVLFGGAKPKRGGNGAMAKTPKPVPARAPVGNADGELWEATR